MYEVLSNKMDTESQNEKNAEDTNQEEQVLEPSEVLQKDNEPEKEEVISIGKEINIFVQHIDSLATSFPLTRMILQAVLQNSHEEYRTFIGENCAVNDSKGRELVTVEPQHLFQYNKLIKELDSGALALKIVPRSLLVSLVSQFDSFLGRLLKALFYLKPEMLNTSEKSLTFSQLIEFKSIDNAKEHIIEKEIEAVLRKSHSEQFDWLEKKFNIPLRKDLPAWPVFIELTERRNLFVHANGAVSSQYLRVCKDNKVNLKSDVKVGMELDVSPKYFMRAYQCIYEIGVKLAQVLWRKHQPDDIQAADKHLNNTAYDLLREEKNKMAITLLDFATSVLKKCFDEEQRRISIINRAQAYKWIGNAQKAREIVESEDWSATSVEFKLAEAVLLDDFANAASFMKKIGPNGFPSKSDYEGWPLFKEFRKSDDFVKAYQEVFEEQFGVTAKGKEEVPKENPETSSETSSTEIESIN